MSAADTISWQAIAERLRRMVARRCPAGDVDDVLQEVLLRVHRGLSSLRDEQGLAPWLRQIANNAVTDHLRARSRQPVSEALLDPRDDEAPRSAETLLAENLSAFVKRLPPAYRDAIILTEIEGRTHREAAEELGISLSGVKSRVQRGRTKLRAMLEQCCYFALDSRNRIVDFERRPPSSGDCC